MLFEKQMVNMIRSQLCVRQDNPNGIFYFSPEDFPGLKADGYEFQSQLGHSLKGFFYHYDNLIPGRLLVFDHGMGNGHRAYMREIERLCRGGYLVFSYDHTGCMASGGKHIGGFAQSLADLDDCIHALKEDPTLEDRLISVVGHSWGGFSTMNITALHPQITHVVSMSGFVSVERIVKQSLGKLLAPYVPAVVQMEQRENPRYARFNALETLRKTTAKVLLVYSEDDTMVHKAMHYDPLAENLSGRQNIRFLLLNGKDHNPTYTAEAVKYKNTFWAELSKAIKQKKLETPETQAEFMGRYDFLRMTEQDETVWQAILDHLKS